MSSKNVPDHLYLFPTRYEPDNSVLFKSLRLRPSMGTPRNEMMYGYGLSGLVLTRQTKWMHFPQSNQLHIASMDTASILGFAICKQRFIINHHDLKRERDLFSLLFEMGKSPRAVRFSGGKSHEIGYGYDFSCDLRKWILCWLLRWRGVVLAMGGLERTSFDWELRSIWAALKIFSCYPHTQSPRRWKAQMTWSLWRNGGSRSRTVFCS